MNIACYLRMSAREYGDKVVAMEGDREITYSELDDKSNRIASWLRKSGVRPGERGIIYMPNNIEYCYLLFGMFKAGVIPIPLNHRFQKEDIRYVIMDSGASLMFVLERNALLANELQKEVSTLEQVVVSDEESSGSNALINEVLKRYNPDPDIFPALDDDLAMILYTSGTTAKPKGVKQTHRNIVANANVFAFTQQLTSRDRFLCATPLFHVGGMVPSFATILTGGSVVFLPIWDATKFLELVDRKRVTWTILVRLMGAQLAGTEGTDKYDLSSLKYIVFGGAPVSEAIYNNIQKQFNIAAYELYGRTEHVGVSISYEMTDTRVPGSAGKLLRQVIKGKFVDPLTGEAVGIGEPGELMVKGDIVTPGYWNKAEENIKLFDEEGWQHTGDVFTQDEQGYLFFMERTDDMIMSGGENIYPREIESVLYNHPGVAEVAVIGLPHEEWGAQVTAVIVKKDPKLTEEKIVAYLKGRKDLSGYKRPRSIKFIDKMPKTATEKIDKAALKKLY